MRGINIFYEDFKIWCVLRVFFGNGNGYIASYLKQKRTKCLCLATLAYEIHKVWTLITKWLIGVGQNSLNKNYSQISVSVSRRQQLSGI